MGVRFRFGKLRRNKYYLLIAVVLVVAAGSVATKALFLGGSGGVSSTGDIELQRGLVGHWKLDGNAKDSTPYGDSGVSTGSPTASVDREGAASSATTFDGSTNYYTIPNSPTLQVTGSETISMWLKPASFTGRQNPYAKAYGGEGTITQETGGALTYYYGTAGSNASPYQQIGTGNVLTIGTWTHVAIVRDLSAMTLKWYVNGALKASATASYSAATASTLATYIGNGYAGKYNGSIDDVRLYNRALSAGEVSALYNEYDPGIKLLQGDSGLIGHWKLDGNAKDSSPYSNNGTITGATPTTDRKGTANGAMSFGGTSGQGISVPGTGPYDGLGTNSFTLSSWIKTTDAGNQRCIFSTAGGGQGFRFGFQAGRPYYLVGDGTHYQEGTIGTNNTLDNGNWHHLSIVYAYASGWSVTAYIDGTSVGSVTLPTTIGSVNDTYAHMGSMTGGGVNGTFAGSVDDVRIYNRALSAGEIANLYNTYDSAIGVGGAPGAGSGVHLTSGLVGDWEFNGNARDSTPYSNNGTVSGATLTTDRLGRANSAYTFNGTSNYITLANNATNKPTKGITISTWINPSDLSTDGRRIISSTESGGYNMLITTTTTSSGCSTNSICLSMMVGGSYRGTSMPSSLLTTGTWSYITGTYDGSTFRIYLNGVQEASVAYSGTIQENLSSPICIGSEPGSSCSNGGYAKFEGSIDDVRIYNRALSAAEVTALYNLSD